VDRDPQAGEVLVSSDLQRHPLAWRYDSRWSDSEQYSRHGETNTCSSRQEITSILLNTAVQCSAHEMSLLVPIVSQMNPVQALQSHLRLILILWSSLYLISKSCVWAISFTSSYQIYLLSHPCYMTAHIILSNLFILILRGATI
jgi:hypothetical protein